MVTTKHPNRLTPSELDFWQAAFLAAELPVLLKGDGLPLGPSAAAHLAADYADAAITEFRNAKNGARS